MSSSCINLYPENTAVDVFTKVADEDLAEIVNQNLSEAVFRCASDGQILYVNKAFINLFEIKDSIAVMGQKAEIYYNDELCLNSINRSLKSQKKFNGEVEFKKVNGIVFHGHLSARLIHKGTEEFVDGVIRDISSEKISKLEIERQTEIQKILLKISSSYLDSDIDDIDKVINQSLHEIGSFLGADRLQVLDYNFERGKCLISYEWVTEGIQASNKKSHEFPLEFIYEMVASHEQGNHVFYPSIPDLPDSQLKEELISQNVKSSLTIPMKLNAQCVGFLALDSIYSFSLEYSENVISMLKLFANMVANVSFRAKGHIRLRKLVEQVTLQGKQHKDFSFITSHNIRASVANLVAITDLMNQEFSPRYLEMLDVTVKKLNESINNINNILHLDQNELLKRSICDVKQSVDRVLESLEMVIVNQGLIIENKVPRSLLLNTLPTYLENILFQLISNAIKFGTNDSTKRITISAERLSRKIVLSITDYGDGFDIVKHAHQMFQVGARFNQKHTDGQGLGLYITKQQIESLDGTIDIESKKGAGTVVKLSFPIF